MPSTVGRTLELFFIDGGPDGMLTAAVFNWTGHILKAPRTRLVDALKRKEASYAGVYILLGEQDGKPRIYVGEGEDISSRIKSHDVKKEWWNTAILITSAANGLNKAHIKYIESRLVDLASTAKRMDLENGNAPSLSSLSEAAVSDMEFFLENTLMVLPALQIDAFRQDVRSVFSVQSPDSSPVFELVNQKLGLTATAVLDGEDFVVREGSMARSQWTQEKWAETSYAILREELVRQGVLVPQGNNCVFAKSYAFRSPSAAAAVVLGRSASGPREWATQGDGILYKDWEQSRLAGSEP